MNLRDKYRTECEYYRRKRREKRDKRSFYELNANRHPYERLLEIAGSLDGKRVLDFGCGSGWASIEYDRRGAEVFTFDISQDNINVAKDNFKKNNVDGLIRIDKMAAESLQYDDESFDIIIGRAILHHTNMPESIKEAHRVLKRGGKAFFIEPLNHNPLIKLYRKQTPEKRTPTEKPLDYSDIQSFKNIFADVSSEEYYFLALAAFFWYFIIRNDQVFLKSMDLLVKIDRRVLRLFPALRKYCWSTLICLKK